METEFNEWSNFPITLSPAEISDPFSVIDNFFSTDDLPGHLTELRKWRDRVIGPGYFTDAKGNPSSLLSIHELNLKLIEAAQVLRKPSLKEELAQYIVSDSFQLEDERKALQHYPDSLHQSELSNPLQAIDSFFGKYNLDEYRCQLYDWLTYALSAQASNEFVQTIDMVIIYENLQKLYGAMWMLKSRRNNSRLRDEHKSSSMAKAVRLYELNSIISACDQLKLSNIVSVIKHKLPSTNAVIYLGCKPERGYSIFLLVLTADHEQGEALSLGTMLEESCRPENVTILIHYASTVLNAVNIGDRFFSRALASPAIYLSGELLLPNTILTGPKFNIDISEANWERWLKQGKEFLMGAEYYLSVQAYSAALFSLHQSAECILIAIVRAVLGYRINSHNLLRLLRVTQFFTNDLVDIFQLGTEDGKKNFNILKEAYISVRYRDNYQPDITSVETLHPIVANLQSTAELVHGQFLLTNII